MACQVTIAERKQRLRNKRGPGKGLLDWIKLCRSFKQQQNSAKNIVVTFEELHKHNKEDDCWTAFRGNTAKCPARVTIQILYVFYYSGGTYCVH